MKNKQKFNGGIASCHHWVKTCCILFGILLHGVTVANAEENDFKKCCDMGTSWATEDLECSKFSGPVAGVPKFQQGICLRAVDLCCLRTHRDMMCEKGKSDARSGTNCTGGSFSNGDLDNDRKNCCEGCQLGISMSKSKGCSLSFSIGEPLDSAFKDCCENPENETTNGNKSTTVSISTTNKLNPSSTTTDDDFDDIFGDDTSDIADVTRGLNLCQIMKGLLCSHICIPDKNSYHCECPENYTLLEDKRTCKNNAPIDRCKTEENLCDQICNDTGNQIECSCNDGYMLDANNHTCVPKTTERITRTTSVFQNKDPALRCPLGYKFNVTSDGCDDIDECADKRYICGNETCYNLPGGYICAKPPEPITGTPTSTGTVITSTTFYTKNCSSGYRSDQYGNCVDIDECKESNDACDSYEDCVNNNGSFVCNCKKGFQRDNLTTACVDINECQTGQNDCLESQRCDNIIGGFSCVRFLPCGTGYTLNAATEVCEDDDECALGTHDCGDGYYCKNTLGSYRCHRNTKKYPKTTTTTYRTRTFATTTPATTVVKQTTQSTTTRPSTTTQIPTTATKSTTARITTTARTTTTARATTTTRSTTTRRTTTRPTTRPTTTITTSTKLTTTVPSTRLTTEPSTTTAAPPTIVLTTPVTRSKGVTLMHTCPRGFDTGSSGQCIDIDECKKLPRPCPRGGQCINTLGSYKCQMSQIICGNGYTYDPMIKRCMDVDECAEGIHECGKKQTCENRQGGYLCACPTGHMIRNKECIDIDECSLYQGRICGTNAKCENKIGSYRCNCDPGFENNDGQGACQDINECEKNPNTCQHMCINYWGSYRCGCKSGYKLNADNKTCSDIDECVEFKDNNLCIGICDNTPGSYSCICPRGYKLGLDGRTCQDIDECELGTVCKNPGELCQNTRGSYRCNRINCPPGYTQDKDRKNRCVRTTRFCSITDQKCIRSPSHYSYNFITFVSMLPIPSSGQLELFTMKGAHLPTSTILFTMAFIEARAPPDVVRATESCFALQRKSSTQVVLVLTKSIAGPQEIELELSMEIYNNNEFAGSAVAKIFILVSQYEF